MLPFSGLPDFDLLASYSRSANTTFITLLLPAMYSIFVLDLKIAPWERREKV